MPNTETNRIEYKRELNDKLERTVVSFLNYSGGGELLIGVDDNGVAVGLADIDGDQCKIVDRIRNNIRPTVLGLFEVVKTELDGKNIIRVVVSSGTQKPYYIRNRGRSESGCFIRVGNSVQPMTEEMIEDLLSRRQKASLQTTVSPRQKLTFKQLQIYYQDRNLELNDTFTENLDLRLSDGGYNYAAYLLADENGASIKVAKYAGTNKVDLIENNEYGYRCLITAAIQVLNKLEVENRTFAKITSKQRLEKSMVDKVALREAVINAIVHNDYTLTVPLIEIFSDRITVTSAGGLVEGLTEESFFNCRSMPRNRELMRVFKDVELVEHLGSGMGRILKAYDRSIFDLTSGFVVVTFPFTNGYDNEVGTNGTNNGTNKNGNISMILKAISENPSITLDALAKATSLSRRTIAREIKIMQESGLIKRHGSTRGHWEIL